MNQEKCTNCGIDYQSTNYQCEYCQTSYCDNCLEDCVNLQDDVFSCEQCYWQYSSVLERF